MDVLKPACPTCRGVGRKVSMTTVEVLSREAPAWTQAWFCETADCRSVYFNRQGETIPVEGLKVPVYQKESSPSRLLCYCFGHSVADIEAANRPDGGNRIIDEVSAACRKGLDRCEVSNPQGRCCLGNARALFRSSAPADCCGGGA